MKIAERASSANGRGRVDRRRWLRLGSSGLIAAALVMMGIGRLGGDEREGSGLLFEIPFGASQWVPAGQRSAVEVPTEIVFAADKTATITVINNDTVTHLAGPFLVGPGQTFVQRFPSPGVYPITCTVNAEESVVVRVQS